MNIAIIIFSILCLSIHCYLNVFYSAGLLPSVSTFLLWVKIKWLLILISVIIIFGWLWGIIAFIIFLFGSNIIFAPIAILYHLLDISPKLALGCYANFIIILGILLLIKLFI